MLIFMFIISFRVTTRKGEMNYANVRRSLRSRSHRIKGLLTRHFGPFSGSAFRGREELLLVWTVDFFLRPF